MVALTAQAFAEQVEACRLAGMDSHLTKPFTQQALQATLAQAVSAAAVRTGTEQRSPDSTPLGDGGAKLVATAAAGLSAAGAELGVFNPEVCDGTAAYLSAEAVRSYLRTIADGAESLMLALRRDTPDSSGNLAEAAHTLAGTAGMFGFDRTAAVARRFEQAAKAGAPETQALAARLAAVIVRRCPTCAAGPEAPTPSCPRPPASATEPHELRCYVTYPQTPSTLWPHPTRGYDRRIRRAAQARELHDRYLCP